MAVLKFIQTTEQGLKPVRRTARSAGYDLLQPNDLSICPGETVRVDFHNRVVLPRFFAGLLVLRSGAVSQHRLLLHAGLIGEPRGERVFSRSSP